MPALGGVRAFGLAWERLLSARLLPFCEPPLSAQLRRTRTQFATLHCLRRMLRAGVYEASFRNRRSWRTLRTVYGSFGLSRTKSALGIDLAVGRHRWRW